MKKHRTGFLVLMLTIAFAPIFNSCSKDDEVDAGKDIEFTFPPNLILSNDGDNNAVDLNLADNIAWHVEVQGEEMAWCDVTPASGRGAGRFVITTEPNAKRTERYVKLLVTAGKETQTMTVYQKDTLNVSVSDNMVVSNQGDTLRIVVEANTTWEVEMFDRPNWVSFTPNHGQGRGEVTIVVGSNPLLGGRSAELVIYAGSVNRLITIAQQDVTPTAASDSLALVALYQATGGAYWRSPWNLEQGIAAWQGVVTEMKEGQLRVTKLYLTSREMDGVIPPAIANLSYLERLDLSGNNIHGEIPTEIGLLTKLKELNISGNKFDGEIPLSIRNLSELEKLNAQNNRFKTFPVEICQLAKLKNIQLENNEISSLPGEITQMSSLEYLYLNNNRLTALPEGLDKLPKLIYLHASGNQITTFPEEIGKLVNLVSLKLNSNRITGTIPAGLSNLVALKYLYLSDNAFTGGFPADMYRMEALQSLEAYDCGLTGAIPEFGKDGAFSRLTNIWMSGNRLTGELTEALSSLRGLTILVLDDNELSGTLPANALGNTSNLSELKHLGLSGNRIGGTIPAGLARRLNGWPSMSAFRLNGNNLQGPVPKAFNFFSCGTYKYAQNLFPQRDGVVLEFEK